MRVIFSNKVLMAVPNVVSYMKNNIGYDYNTIQSMTKNMLTSIQNRINKDSNNYNFTYLYNSCWWSDGKNGIAWIFDYVSFPRKGFAMVYNIRYDRVSNVVETAEPIKKVKSLMERIEGKKISN